jgi:hypothetical protein
MGQSRQEKKDAEYLAARARQDRGGSPANLVRWFPLGQYAELYARYSHLIKENGDAVGKFKQVILKKGNEDKLTDYMKH